LSGIFPFASINVQEQIIDFKLFQFLTETEGNIALNQPVWGALFFWLQNIIFALFIIFAYNNRPKQAKLCKILCLTELIYLITMGTYAFVLSSKINGNIAPTFATCLPLLAIVFAIFAKRLYHFGYIISEDDIARLLCEMWIPLRLYASNVWTNICKLV
jgi:hypothetical protein